MPRLRLTAALVAVASLAAGTLLASCRSPERKLALADRAISEGGTASGVRLKETALAALDVKDPKRWDRLGEIAADVDDVVADRAFERAELLLWPTGEPSNVAHLSLPFAGRWRVTQANRGEFSHRRLADRFAWDFQMVDEHGNPGRDGGEGPASFLAFGAPILAPADGVVQRAEDGVRDNVDGFRNYRQAGGNVVVVRHASGEMSHFCHLQRGSVAVRVGQTVRRGELLGRCGCSGNAIEPHLHFVLRAGPTVEDHSVPMRFDDIAILRSSNAARNGVPREGDIVERSVRAAPAPRAFARATR